MNLSAVDRSGLGGWLLKGICSFRLITPISTFQVIFLVDYISEMFFCFKNIENKISSLYFIYFMVVFCYLVIQRTFIFMKKSYLLLFHFILFPGWFFLFSWVFSWMLSGGVGLFVESKKLKFMFWNVTYAKGL